MIDSGDNESLQNDAMVNSEESERESNHESPLQSDIERENLENVVQVKIPLKKTILILTFYFKALVNGPQLFYRDYKGH